MRWTDEYLYERILAKDASFNGRILTGVLTTGIYCLPSCPARKPMAVNVRFFEDESAAREAGLRPCKRCRYIVDSGDLRQRMVRGLFQAGG